MTLKVDVSAGEFLDKMTILEIKSERMKDEEKLRNVHKELDLLRKTWAESPLSRVDVSSQVEDLKRVNESLWDVEDLVRLKEAAHTFDDEFVQLARWVYQANDKRAAIKRELNRLLGSELMEEKSYPDYPPPSD
jgi:3-methyladenine DNA glycosylase/8-oxoguanine DNA glycosylase